MTQNMEKTNKNMGRTKISSINLPQQEVIQSGVIKNWHLGTPQNFRNMCTFFKFLSVSVAMARSTPTHGIAKEDPTN